jgi:50S ribosomal protein L16 3-hydroxylase
MDTNTPLALLGGLTASQFMRRHWHKKPLLVRQAIPGFKPLIPRARLLAMAGEDGVESRLIQQLDGGAWKLSHGPLSRRSLPSLQKPGWTVLVQGVDLHDDGVHQLMQQFRFVPEAAAARCAAEGALPLRARGRVRARGRRHALPAAQMGP